MNPTVWRTTFRQVFVLSVIALVPGALSVVFDWQWKAPAEFHELSSRDAQRQMNKLCWVDVRDPERFERGHVAGAVCFDEKMPAPAMQRLRSIWTPAFTFVVYGEGAGSERAERAARLLKTEFHTKAVWLLQGGWAAWPRDFAVEKPVSQEAVAQ
jgi:rhodanese-related sulfurtransferase